MMGDRLMMQESLFYQFRLDDHVPAYHMLRVIDRFLDLDFDLDALRRIPLPRRSGTWPENTALMSAVKYLVARERPLRGAAPGDDRA